MSASNRAAETVSPLKYFSHTFQAFRYRDFRLLWFGAFTSTTGTWMQIVAQSWVVLELTGSAFYLGLVGFLGQLPVILFTLLGGAFADRIDRRRLLLISQYVQMGVAALLTVLVFLERIEVWHFLVLVFVSGSGQAFGGPAYQALIPGLVKREHVSNAVALNSIQFNLARMVGPVIAGAALASLGAVICFGLNTVSFVAVIVALYLIRATFVPQKGQGSVLTEIGRGFKYIGTKGDLWQLTVLGFVSTFCGIPVLTLLPVFARDVFQLGASGYSNMMAISGAGSILGALLYASYSGSIRQGFFTLRVQILLAAILTGFALSQNLILSCVLLFLGGLCIINLFAAITSLVQLTTSEEMRGRMMSIFMLAFRGGMPLGDLFAGAIASQLSASAALLILSAILAAVAGVFLLTSSGVKRM
jgi:MFS family permease